MSISCLVRSSIQCSTVGAAGGWWLVAVIMTQNKGPDSAVTASRHRHPDKTRVPFISIRVIQIFNVRSVFRQRNRKQTRRRKIEKHRDYFIFYILLSTLIKIFSLAPHLNIVLLPIPCRLCLQVCEELYTEIPQYAECTLYFEEQKVYEIGMFCDI